MRVMHLILRILLILVLLAAAGRAQWPDFAETKKKAEAGDAEAQFTVGLLYANGNGVTQDHAEAMKWYGFAADQGHRDAKYILQETKSEKARYQAVEEKQVREQARYQATSEQAGKERAARDAPGLFFAGLVFAGGLFFYILNLKKLKIKTEGGYKFTTQNTLNGLYYLWPLSIILWYLSISVIGVISFVFLGFAIYKQYQWNKSCEGCYAINSYKYENTAEKNSYRTSINKTISHRNSKGEEYSTSHYTVPGTKVVEKQLWRCGHCSHERYETKTSTYEN